jgi:anti-sigma factor ChrR (cupin superfamily)
MGLAIAAHMDFCQQCTLALGRGQGWRRARQGPATAAPADGGARTTGTDNLPRSLKDMAVGRWRGGGPGVRIAPVPNTAGLGETVHLLKARAAAHLPRAPAAEVVLLIEGVLHAGAAAYEAGDFLHLPSIPEGLRADAGSACVCLIVGDETLYRRPIRDWLLSLWRA